MFTNNIDSKYELRYPEILPVHVKGFKRIAG